MTDVPHAFFLLASLYFCLQELGARRDFRRARRTDADGELDVHRADSRDSVFPGTPSFNRTVAILAIRQSSALRFMESYGELARVFRGAPGISRLAVRRESDPGSLFFAAHSSRRTDAVASADLAVLMGAFAAGWFVIKPIARRGHSGRRARDRPGARFFFATMGMIVAAYLSGAMPIIFPRYGLILFTLECRFSRGQL